MNFGLRITPYTSDTLDQNVLILFVINVLGILEQFGRKKVVHEDLI